jgi:hypothetical protein
MVSIFSWMGAGWAFLSAVFFPSADVVICRENVVNELRQVDAAMKVSMNGFFMGCPVDVLHDGVRPFVSLLDIF